ncbi:MAG: Lead, cadmium, zinc and mercury transporting ATPase [Myxococcales bacterium]|nr:Lead, cadmium, zinc and mercury transporting ATPase [Myxococcales bacterium]
MAERALARYRARMLRSSVMVAVSVLVLGAGACSKDEKAAKKAPPAATVTTGTVGSDGVRKIAIEAGKDGYVPDTIPGKPGEKLILSFTRTLEGECLAELKAPDGKLVALPMGTPVDVAVTVPETGEVKFACGMDMYSGKIVAAKS